MLIETVNIVTNITVTTIAGNECLARMRQWLSQAEEGPMVDGSQGVIVAPANNSKTDISTLDEHTNTTIMNTHKHTLSHTHVRTHRAPARSTSLLY